MPMTSRDNADLYIMMRIDELYLLIPQKVVEAVEIIYDVSVSHMSNGAAGWFGQGYDAPVFCLSEDLSLQQDIPNKREFFILINTADQRLGITCDEVENLSISRDNLVLQPLPEVMQSSTPTPIKQLVLYRDHVAIVCEGEALINHIHHLSDQYTTGNTDL